MIKVSKQTKERLKGLLGAQKKINDEIQVICRTIIDEKGKQEVEYLLDDVNLEIIEKGKVDGD